MLEGKTVNLRKAEKDEASLVMEWWGNPQYMGGFQDVMIIPKEKMEKIMLEDTIFFIIEKKDGTKVGHIGGFMGSRTSLEIGYALIPSERGRGYGTEAIQIIVDYLFLEKDCTRIQAPAAVENIASQKALERAGFSREGLMRKSGHAHGEYIDQYLYSILREEWKEPKILTKTNPPR